MRNHSQNDLIWVSLGGNQGRVNDAFDDAIKRIRALSRPEILESPRYWSAPWGKPGQPRFLNQVVGFYAELEPIELMDYLHLIEAENGRDRDRETRWGPRPLDLDLLCWPGRSGTLGTLHLPHPRLHLRRFVLQPWADVGPQVVPCGLSKTVETLLEQCTDTGTIERCSPS